MKKKVKRFQGGGLSGIADTANSLISEVDGMANSIKYGSGVRSGQQPLGFNSQTAIFPNPSTSSTTTADMTAKTPSTSAFSGSGEGFKALAGMLSGQKTFKKGGKVSSASERADGCAIRGKTRA